MNWLILILLGVSGTASAGQSLSLEQALAEALGQNPQLASAELNVSQAEGGLLSAQSVFDPSFTASGNLALDETNQLFAGIIFEQSALRTVANSGLQGQLATGTNYRLNASYFDLTQDAPDFVTQQMISTSRRSPSFEVGVGQELLRGHRTAFNRRQVIEARNALDIAELRLKAQRQQTLGQVASAYWQWSNTIRLAEIAEERLAVAEEAARIAAVQLGEGRIAPVDEVRVRTELVRARNNVLDAQQQAQLAGDELMILLGRRPGDDVFPSSQIELPEVVSFELDREIQAAEEGNFELRVAELEAEQAELSRRLAAHALLPSLTVDGSFSRSQVTNKQGDLPAQTVPQQNLQGSATFSMPLGNRASRGEVRRASAIEGQRKVALEDQRRQVVAQVARQVRVLNAAKVQVDLTEQEVELAAETLAAEEARDEVGRALQRDVLDARTSLFDSKARAAKARMDYELAVVELRRLQGLLELVVMTR
ncbi:MAG: TolC family protein [Deltaproteobacteria bacterium]|nr:MAG: TolC family protein [Deltaproteobacteria bacterium]